MIKKGPNGGALKGRKALSGERDDTTNKKKKKRKDFGEVPQTSKKTLH